MIFNIKETKDAKTLEGHGAEYFLPKSGGIVSKSHVSPLGIESTSSNNTRVLLQCLINGVLCGHLGFDGVDNPVFRSTDGEYNPLLHGGNYSDYTVPNKVEVLSTSVLEEVKNLPSLAVRFYKINGSLYTGGDLPSGDYYKYSNVLAFKYDVDTAVVIIFGFGRNTRRMAVNHMVSNAWQGWQLYATDAELAKYLQLTGGTVSSASGVPFGVRCTSGNYAHIAYNGADGVLGYLGFTGADTPIYKNKDGSATYNLLHTGNSAKVVIDSTAPSDTTALWIDTSA